ncbi:RNase H family protein [Rhodovulum strictum]|uniref:RNase H family protein n=1 Tax=Rhodovulum strictum TaxID=58314 RepID=UPI00147942F2
MGLEGINDRVKNGLRCLRRDEVAPIIIRSDSQYLIKGMSEWTPGWIKRGWRKSDGRPVENQDLWIDLLSEATTRTLNWQWVRGHAGDKYNEEVDAIAQAQAQVSQKPT